MTGVAVTRLRFQWMNLKRWTMMLSTRNLPEGDSVLSDSARMDLEAQKRAEDPHFVEYYLKQIPKTPEEIQTCHDIIQEGLYNMGVILKDRLEDFGASDNRIQYIAVALSR